MQAQASENELKTELMLLNKQLETLQTENHDLDEQISAMQLDFEKAHERSKEAQKEIAARDRAIEHHKAQIKDLEDGSRNLKDQMRETNRKNKDLEASVADLTEEVHTKTNEIASLTQENYSAAQKTHKNLKTLENLNQDRERLEDRCEALQSENAQIHAELRATIAELETSNTSAKLAAEDVHEYQNRCEKLKDSFGKAKELLKSKQLEIAELRKKEEQQDKLLMEKEEELSRYVILLRQSKKTVASTSVSAAEPEEENKDSTSSIASRSRSRLASKLDKHVEEAGAPEVVSETVAATRTRRQALATMDSNDDNAPRRSTRAAAAEAAAPTKGVEARERLRAMRSRVQSSLRDETA